VYISAGDKYIDEVIVHEIYTVGLNYLDPNSAIIFAFHVLLGQSN